MKGDLFVGAQITAPWPETWPPGRLIEEKERHATLLFLGPLPKAEIEPELPSCPPPPIRTAPCGTFVRPLFLPSRGHKRLIAWEVKWHGEALALFRSTLTDWISSHPGWPRELSPFAKNKFTNLTRSQHKFLRLERATIPEWQGASEDPKLVAHPTQSNANVFFANSIGPWLPHVTIARTPFDKRKWIDTFRPLPLYAPSIHLYESLGERHYRSLFAWTFSPPFTPIPHTADIAFRLAADSPSALYASACTALAFWHPPLLSHFPPAPSEVSTERLAQALNEAVFRLDVEEGCPCKAVSLAGGIGENREGIWEWEMVIDV